MTGEKIVLTSQEVVRAREAVARHLNDADIAIGVEIVDLVVQTVNRIRHPDPVGTVRRHADGAVAVRRRRHWLIVHPDYSYGRRADDVDLSGWEVLYKPEPPAEDVLPHYRNTAAGDP